MRLADMRGTTFYPPLPRSFNAPRKPKNRGPFDPSRNMQLAGLHNDLAKWRDARKRKNLDASLLEKSMALIEYDLDLEGYVMKDKHLRIKEGVSD